MFSLNPQIHSPEVVLEKHISVKAAAGLSGNSIQYLRRLLRIGQLDGTRIRQAWLIKLASLDAYLKRANNMDHGRCGPRAALTKGTKLEMTGDLTIDAEQTEAVQANAHQHTRNNEAVKKREPIEPLSAPEPTPESAFEASRSYTPAELAQAE